MQRPRWIRDGREGSESIDEPHNAVTQMRDIKIKQQTEPESTKLEISEQLSAIHDCVPDILLDHLCVLCVSIASFALPNLLKLPVSRPRPGPGATTPRGQAGS